MLIWKNIIAQLKKFLSMIKNKRNSAPCTCATQDIYIANNIKWMCEQYVFFLTFDN